MCSLFLVFFSLFYFAFLYHKVYLFMCSLDNLVGLLSFSLKSIRSYITWNVAMWKSTITKEWSEQDF